MATEILYAAVRRTRRNQLVFAAVAAALACVFALSPASGDDRIVKIVLALVTAAAAVLIARPSLKPLETDPVVRALADGGRNVVWIYIQRHSRYKTSQTGYAAHLKLGLADGTALSLRVPLKTADDYLRAARELVPQASVGFDPELQRRFRASPQSLRSC